VDKDADRIVLDVEAGDVVLLGTDGVWDNLFLSEISEVLEPEDWFTLAEKAHEALGRETEEEQQGWADVEASLSRIAKTLVKCVGRAFLSSLALWCASADSPPSPQCMLLFPIVLSGRRKAVHVGADRSAVSPFSAEAREHGLRFDGGKLDDTMLIVALVVSSAGDEEDLH